LFNESWFANEGLSHLSTLMKWFSEPELGRQFKLPAVVSIRLAVSPKVVGILRRAYGTCGHTGSPESHVDSGFPLGVIQGVGCLGREQQRILLTKANIFVQGQIQVPVWVATDIAICCRGIAVPEDISDRHSVWTSHSATAKCIYVVF